MQGVNGLGLSGMLDGFELQSDNSWLPLARKTIIASIGNINITDRDGKIVDNQPIHTLNGKYTVYGAFVESCKLKSTPVSDYITIFKFSAAEIKNYSPNMTSVLGESLTPFTTLRGVTIRNGVIIEVPLNIDNEQVSDLNSNFFDCNDVNGDGYADLVVYPYNANGLPFVYLNDKSSSFKYAGQSNFQNLTLPYAGSNAVTSIFKDFNGDGINDLLVFPGNPFNPNGVIEYKFLRGVKLFK